MVNPPQSVSDGQFLDGISARVLNEFRDTIFTPAGVQEQPGLFLDTDWVNVASLRRWMEKRTDPNSDPRHVKVEESSAKVKLEPVDHTSKPIHASKHVKTRVIRQADIDIIEILDSGDEMDVACESEQADAQDIEDLEGEPEYDALSVFSDLDSEYIVPSSDDTAALMDDDFPPLDKPTAWADEDFISRLEVKRTKITKQLSVDRVEYLTEIPSVWPINRHPTAFIINLNDPKFDLNRASGKPFSADGLIKNKDQDSWRGTTGTGDAKAMVYCFEDHDDPVECRRSRLKCNGVHACSEIAQDLVDVTRFELDITAKDNIIAAQIKTQREEGNSSENIVIAFYNVIHAGKCKALDSQGNQCNGVPVMKALKKGRRGKYYFIACGGWDSKFRDIKHRAYSIPDHVDETMLSKIFKDEIITNQQDDTVGCSKIVPSRIGMKQINCPHPHLANGKAVQGRIQHRPCDAECTIYVPVNTNLRMAVVIHDHRKPHNHPMPVNSKASIEAKEKYRECIMAHGLLGATVQKIDNAPSTQLIATKVLDVSLQSKRIKRDLLRMKKEDQSPKGLGLVGVFDRFQSMENRALTPGDRYIHNVTSTLSGGIFILTFDLFLLCLIHDALSFEVDTTFKRVRDKDINEWEVVIFHTASQRAVTVARVYTDKADRPHYKKLFDELQEATLIYTGKPLRFKRLTPGGTLLALNSDMEAPQAQGAGDSFLPTNVPEYSGIHTTDPEEIIQYFLKMCFGHVKRPIHDFKGLVAPEDHKRLMDFPYMERGWEDVAIFTKYVEGLNVKKIQDWWKHKLQYKWILPGIIQSCSHIHLDDWRVTPSTTNTGEGQHHWTNHQTGIKLPLLEAIDSACVVDRKTASDIKVAMKEGIITNSQNTMHHRFSRNIRRANTAAEKSRDVNERADASAQIKKGIELEKAARKESAQRQKDLEEQLKAAKNKLPNDHPALLQASSCGRVQFSGKAPRRKTAARVLAQPYPQQTPSMAGSATSSAAAAILNDTTTLTAYAANVGNIAPDGPDMPFYLPVVASSSNTYREGQFSDENLSMCIDGYRYGNESSYHTSQQTNFQANGVYDSNFSGDMYGNLPAGTDPMDLYADPAVFARMMEDIDYYPSL